MLVCRLADVLGLVLDPDTVDRQRTSSVVAVLQQHAVSVAVEPPPVLTRTTHTRDTIRYEMLF